MKAGQFLLLMLLSEKSENPVETESREEAVAGCVSLLMGSRVPIGCSYEESKPSGQAPWSENGADLDLRGLGKQIEVITDIPSPCSLPPPLFVSVSVPV